MQALRRMSALYVAVYFLVVTLFVSSGAVMGEQESDPATAECIYSGNPELANRYFKYEIQKPGHYCLTEDLHARLDMADHAAESTMITIWNTSNVVLDLQGHTLGRGRVFKNPGGVGIRIHNSKNVLVKNGVVQDFKSGVVRGPEYAMSSDFAEVTQYDTQTNTFRFPISVIVLENIHFMNNQRNFYISAPGPGAQ